MKQLFIFIALITFILGCSQSTESPKPAALPDPEFVGFSAVPEATADIYFLIGEFNNYREILRRTLQSGANVQEAWIPLSTSPCACATCMEAMQIRVIGATEQLDELGFVQNTDPWQINCGVQDFAYYDFTETE